MKKAGLNFEDYILFRGKRMIVDPGNGNTFGIKLNGLVTFDKTRLFGDMKKGKNIHWGAHPKDINELKGFDMVIDATGFHRSLMPKLEHDAAIPCFEVEVEGKFPWDDFYIRPYPGLSGYFWYFPLGEGRGHIGAGDFKAQYRGEIEAMIKKYDWKVVRRIGRPVRILPPAYMGPFYTEPKCMSCNKTIRNTKLLRNASKVSSGQTAGTTVLSSSGGQVATTTFAERGGSTNGGATQPNGRPNPLNGHGWCDCSSPRPARTHGGGRRGEHRDSLSSPGRGDNPQHAVRQPVRRAHGRPGGVLRSGPQALRCVRQGLQVHQGEDGRELLDARASSPTSGRYTGT